MPWERPYRPSHPSCPRFAWPLRRSLLPPGSCLQVPAAGTDTAIAICAVLDIAVAAPSFKRSLTLTLRGSSRRRSDGAALTRFNFHFLAHESNFYSFKLHNCIKPHRDRGSESRLHVSAPGHHHAPVAALPACTRLNQRWLVKCSGRGSLFGNGPPSPAGRSRARPRFDSPKSQQRSG